MATDEFTVLDVETTGLRANTDRIVEVGLVRIDRSGRVLHEWSSLVNPLRDIGPTHIHGVTAGLVATAPVFEQIAGDVLDFIDGSVLVGHNLNFDARFMTAEFARLGVDDIDLTGLCTLSVLYSVYPHAPRRLSACCEHLGIPVSGAHEALADARMTAALLAELLAQWSYPVIPPAIDTGHRLVPSGFAVRREQAVDPRAAESSYLGQLVAALPPAAPTGLISVAAAAEYLNLVDRVLEDRRVTADEAFELANFAESMRLSSGEITGLHASYVAGLCKAAVADGVVTRSERSDLNAVAELLSVAGWESLLEVTARSSSAKTEVQCGFPAGTTVCFTGEMALAREEVTRLSEERGLVPKSGVSRKLDLLVVADPHTQSAKARKAHDLGVRIMAEQAYYQMLGIIAGRL